jgi:RHS repeat-associated protein
MDAASRLTGVVNPSGERTTLAYDPAGRTSTLAYASGAAATYSYDAASRTTGVRNAKSDGTAIAGFVYTLDDAGNPTGMVLANGDRVTWTYDSLNRLTREQRDGSNAYDVTYTYDATSNRLTKLSGGVTTTYTYNAGDALTVENAGGTVATFSYDNAGNTALVEAAGGVTSYTWDPENRLTGIVLPAGGGTWTMAYDPSGLRREKQAAGTTTRFIFDGQRLLQETDGSNATQAQYTSLLGTYGPTVSQRRGATSTFLHGSLLGTIESLSAADQSVVDTYLFDAWGNLLASSGSTVNPHRYIGALGYYAEPTLGLDYVRARWLRPGTGSWLSVDPVRGEARYGYAYARPAAAHDASGVQPDGAAGQVAGWIAGAAGFMKQIPAAAKDVYWDAPAAQWQPGDSVWRLPDRLARDYANCVSNCESALSFAGPMVTLWTGSVVGGLGLDAVLAQLYSTLSMSGVDYEIVKSVFYTDMLVMGTEAGASTIVVMEVGVVLIGFGGGMALGCRLVCGSNPQAY